jgi:DNA polymerase-3 subunit beta
MLTLDRDTLAPISGRAARLVPSRSAIPILAAVKVEAGPDGVHVTATNLEAQLRERIDVGPREPFVCAVDASLLAGFIDAAPAGPVNFTDSGLTVLGRSIEVAAGPAMARLAPFPVEAFPAFRGPDHKASRFRLPASALRDALRLAATCVSDEETRKYLCGVYLHAVDGHLTAAATDGHRLVVCRVAEVPWTHGVIVPTPTVERLVGLLRRNDAAITCAVDERCVEFTIGDAVLSSKLVDGQFPEYARVVAPRVAAPIVLSRDRLSEALRRLALVDERGGAVILGISPDALWLSAGIPGENQIVDKIDIEGGADHRVGLNLRYLASAIAAIEAPQIELHVRGEAAQIRVCAADNRHDGFTIMPMRI